MAPPTTKPRIQQIDPEALASAVEDEIVHHVERFIQPLFPGVRVVLYTGTSLRNTAIGATVRALAKYAISGEMEDVGELVEEIASILGTPFVASADRSADPTFTRSALRGEVDIDDLDSSVIAQLALVICAAVGREHIELGRPVSASQLAALAGTSTRQVQYLSRNKTITGTELVRHGGGGITAESARSWLAGRGTLVAKRKAKKAKKQRLTSEE
jgi:hypothetical protein